MKKTIIKVKVKNDLPIITYNKEHDDHKTTEVQESGPYLLHEDFKNALMAFRPHLAVMCDLRESDTIKDIDNCHEENFSYINITGISVSGEGDDQGLVLIGNKEIGKKVLNLTTPFQKIHDEMDSYRYESNLVECLQRLQYEANEYLEGKHAYKQLEFEFEAHAEDMD